TAPRQCDQPPRLDCQPQQRRAHSEIRPAGFHLSRRRTNPEGPPGPLSEWRGLTALCAPAPQAPFSAAPAKVAQLAASCEGVLLPGSGADVDPEKYGHERIPECGE